MLSSSRATPLGIYVEILLQSDLNTIWCLTQQPGLYQRWDLRFTSITYLPRPSSAEPRRFLYQTRIGLGLAIRGTGESVGERQRERQRHLHSQVRHD